MEIKILEHTKNKLKVELLGKTHTLCTVLTEELWNDKDVEAAGYRVAHPQRSNAELVVEIKTKDPVKVLNAAIGRLKKKNKEFLTAVKKAVK